MPGIEPLYSISKNVDVNILLKYERETFVI